MTSLWFWQLEQAQAGTLAFPLHVDYHWGHSMEHGFDSEEEEEDKVGQAPPPSTAPAKSHTGPAVGRGRLTVETKRALSPQHCPVKPPAQACWGSGRLDISNKTYETVADPGPATAQSQSEDSPPPLPIKSSSRTILLGRAGHSSGGTVGCPEVL